MSATDLQRHQAMRAAAQAQQPKARLVHCRPSGRMILATLAQPDGTLMLIRAATADHPELDVLAEHERSRVRSAFLALQRR